CPTWEFKGNATEFFKLKQSNSILYYTSLPSEILIKCNKTLTNPTHKAGIINLSQDCKIQTKTLEILPTFKGKFETFRTYFKPSREDRSDKAKEERKEVEKGNNVTLKILRTCII
ncbi:hypothetical protein, partial [Acinetobacter baumannii]|uniref:hypothetical protein n=1 Tax=Acinetobacter baumannii TaxID=470 RepID=UPI001C077E39